MKELGLHLASPAVGRNRLRRTMNHIIKRKDVKVPLSDGAYALADIYNPVLPRFQTRLPAFPTGVPSPIP